jgi:drug/metabolite transporter (DMT)-like permease
MRARHPSCDPSAPLTPCPVRDNAALAHRRARLAQVLLWVVPALWSSNYLIARLARDVVSPHQLALGRWVLALALMLPFVWRAWAAEPGLWRREGPHLLVLGGLGMWICGAFVYLGAQSTSATNIALIYAASPVAIAVAGVRMLHERMNPAQRVGVVFALAGVLFVIAKGDVGNLLAVRFSRGDAWIVAAAASWTAYSVLLKRWPSRLGPAPRLAAVIVGGIVVMLPFTVLEAVLVPTPPLSPSAFGLMALAAVLPGVLSYTAYSYLQRELGAARTALLLYLAPVYGALGAWLVLGERPGWYHLAGAALILPSIWLTTRR